MNKNMIIVIAAFVLILAASVSYGYNEKDMPKNGFVPNAETAIIIAKAICIPIYGEEKINDEQPFKATLVNSDSWLVEGTWNHPDMLGGVAAVKIRKSDGKILEVIHEK